MKWKTTSFRNRWSDIIDRAEMRDVDRKIFKRAKLTGALFNDITRTHTVSLCLEARDRRFVHELPHDTAYEQFNERKECKEIWKLVFSINNNNKE